MTVTPNLRHHCITFPDRTIFHLFAETGVKKVQRFFETLLIALAISASGCGTYRPIEIYRPHETPSEDRTGRRCVSSIFPEAGATYPEEPTAPHPIEQSLQETPAAEGYQPSQVALVLEPSPDNGYQQALNVAIPMRDGVRLMTDFYFPLGEGKYPVLIERTPYDRRAPIYRSERGPIFAGAGLIYAVQTIRGLFDSEGVFYPFKHEGEDGRDLEDWIMAQSWCSGPMGAIGRDYGAYAAVLAASGTSSFKALVLENCSSNIFLDGGLYLNGIPMNAGLFQEIKWRYSSFPTYIDSLHWEDALFHLPLSEMDELLGESLPFWDDCLQNPSFNHFWESFNLTDHLAKIDAAVLHVGGWTSRNNTGGTVANFMTLQSRDESMGIQGRQVLLVGPWSNGINSESSMGFYDFGPAGRIEEEALLVGWFSQWLKESPSAGLPVEDPVNLFLMGSNEWIGLTRWPPSGTRFSSYFLHSGGQAALGWDGGFLSETPPIGFEEIDYFVSDPSNPVMAQLDMGTDDQRPLERRSDVLVYTADPLEADLTVVGTPQVVLYVNTSVADTDLFVMLTDVDEYGYSRPVSHGAIRARFRDSYRAPAPLSPADIVEYVIDLTPCANRFTKGHALRLNIMGSYFPYLTRNLNTGAAVGQETAWQRAPIFLIHDFEFSSRLVLPVLP